jgi:hypothetical protein
MCATHACLRICSVHGRHSATLADVRAALLGALVDAHAHATAVRLAEQFDDYHTLLTVFDTVGVHAVRARFTRVGCRRRQTQTTTRS